MCLNKSFLVGIVLLLCACFSVANDGKDMTAEQNKLIEIAGEYIQEHFPESQDATQLKPIIYDKTEYWEVTFELPELTLGGVPVVHISKDGLKVIKAFHYQ